MKTIYLSKNAHCILIEYLKNKGFSINLIEGSPDFNFGISSHPDIYMCKLGISDESPVFFGDADRLGEKYPEDIRYNAACTGRFFIHNLKYTDNELFSVVQSMGLKTVNTRQGYSKCSIALVDENSAITSDDGSAKAMTAAGIDVLLIEKGHVLLKGYNYGFIGGTCGRVGNELVFNGDLSNHPDYERIKDFVKAKGITLKHFPEYPLEDIGSIICSIDDNEE